MNFSQEQTQNEQITHEPLINEPLTNEAFIEAELSPEDLKQVVGGEISVDVGGSGLTV